MTRQKHWPGFINARCAVSGRAAVSAERQWATSRPGTDSRPALGWPPGTGPDQRLPHHALAQLHVSAVSRVAGSCLCEGGLWF
jgi:hypothetical protein